MSGRKADNPEEATLDKFVSKSVILHTKGMLVALGALKSQLKSMGLKLVKVTVIYLFILIILSLFLSLFFPKDVCTSLQEP